MAKRLQHRGGTTAQHSTFTGAVREVTVDTTKNTLVVHDGATAGGHPLATATNFTSTGIDDNASSTAITIDSSQRVGIGTSPTSLLTVQGTSVIADFKSTNNNNVIRIKGNNATTGVAIGSTNSDDFIFTTNSSEKMRISSSGNVGIGTTSPSTKLHINQGGEPPAEGMLILQANSTQRQLRIQPPTDADNGFIDYKGGNLAFLDDGVEVVRFQGGGRVGIGTSTPSYKLSILENANNFLQFSQSGDASSGSLIGRSSSTNLRIQNSENASTEFWTNNTERMRITDSGYVGIGTTSPSKKLEVQDTRIGIRIKSTGSTGYTQGSMLIEGHETSNAPQSRGQGIYLHNHGSQRSWYMGTMYSNGRFGITTKSNAVFDENTNEGAYSKFTIDNDGNVGIGTVSPNTKFEVVGTGVNGIKLGKQSDGNDSSRLFFTNSTNVCAIRSSGGSLKFSTGATIGSSSGDDRLTLDSTGLLRVNVGGGSSGGILNSAKSAVSVSTTATNISGTNSYGSLAFVYGVSGGNIFHDLVSWSLSDVDVIASQNISSIPAGRTYSASGGVLRVAMSSGTYSVYESDIRTALS